MRIVKNDDIGTFAGDHAALRSRDAMAAAQIVEPAFLVLIGAQLEAMPPKSLIPRRADDLPAFDAVAAGERAVIRQVQEFHARTAPAIGPDLIRIVRLAIRLRILRPDPRWEKHVGAKRLHVPRRHIDQEPALDLPISDRFEMFTNGVDVPIRLKRLWLDQTPRRRSEVDQRVLVAEGISAIAYGESCERASLNEMLVHDSTRKKASLTGSDVLASSLVH